MCYPAAIVRAFSQQAKRGIRVWPELLIGQVIRNAEALPLGSCEADLTLRRGGRTQSVCENDLKEEHKSILPMLSLAGLLAPFAEVARWTQALDIPSLSLW